MYILQINFNDLVNLLQNENAPDVCEIFGNYPTQLKTTTKRSNPFLQDYLFIPLVS